METPPNQIVGSGWPFGCAEVAAKVERFRVLNVSLGAGKQVPWYVMQASTTTVFVRSGEIAIQTKKPPFRVYLSAGQYYTIPPELGVSFFARRGGVEFAVFQYGINFHYEAVAEPTLDFSYELDLVGAGTLPQKFDRAADDLVAREPGFNRMEILATTPELRLLVQGHGLNQCVPWHSHDSVSDTFFCVEGLLRIDTKSPDQTEILAPGGVFEVKRGTPHSVSGVGGRPCLLLVLQGVGAYNYVPFDPSAAGR